MNPNRVAAANASPGDVIVLEYPEATATLSLWHNGPYRERQVEVYGPKGSLLATEDSVFYRPAGSSTTDGDPHGRLVEMRLALHETSNAIAYFVYRIQHGEPIEDPVVEVLDAADESIRTGGMAELPNR
jgi:predicted dehydrogenase